MMVTRNPKHENAGEPKILSEVMPGFVGVDAVRS